MFSSRRSKRKGAFLKSEVTEAGAAAFKVVCDEGRHISFLLDRCSQVLSLLSLSASETFQGGLQKLFESVQSSIKPP